MIRTCLFIAKDPLGCMEWLVQREYLAIIYHIYHRYKRMYILSCIRSVFKRIHNDFHFQLRLQMIKYKWSITNDQIQGLLNRHKFDRGETYSKLIFGVTDSLVNIWKPKIFVFYQSFIHCGVHLSGNKIFRSKIADHKLS